MDNKTPNLNRISLFFAFFVIIKLIFACSDSTSNQPATKDGFTQIEKELKSKFGENAYYTDLSITYNASIGNIIRVTVTEDPESLKMGQWNSTQGNWQQNSNITVEVPTGTKATDYMFQLGESISLSKLGELVEQSVQQLKDEKQLNNPTLSIAVLNFPDTGDISKAKYMINLQPEHGGSTFSFYYTLSGDLIKMDY